MKIRFLISLLFVSVISVSAYGGDTVFSEWHISTAALPEPTPAANADKAAFSDYRGVTLGMSMVDARAKLGKAKDTSDEQDFYMISEGETAQIIFEGKIVRAISTTYMGADVKAPTPISVFGVDVAPKADGSISKVVRYPKAGYWISYVRTEGSDPMVMVTVHALAKGEQ